MLETVVRPLGFVFATFFVVIIGATLHFWPASYWIEVRSVRVFDSQSGDPVVMAVDRTINREFEGHWVASIRRLEGGQWVAYCTAYGMANYEPGASLPDPLVLQWWTAQDCHPLPVGKYIVKTTWRIKGANLLPDKVQIATSNIFEVKQ